MFNNSRYLTASVNASIPLSIQMFLWNCIDLLPAERDYLQVFELQPCAGMQQILHSSEEPEYHMRFLIPTDEPITAKIYVIDDDSHSTMLLADEY